MIPANSTVPAKLAVYGTTSNAVAFTVYGQMYSLKNSRTPLKNSRRTIMNKAAEKFCTDFALQVPAQYRMLRLGSQMEPLRSIVTVFYPSYRQDLDLALLYDLLQKCGVVSNDRWIREHHEYAQIDGVNPRVELILEAI